MNKQTWRTSGDGQEIQTIYLKEELNSSFNLEENNPVKEKEIASLP